MGKVIFVVGGARSGKSTFAASLCKENTTFIATAEALDDEMKKRIALHKRERSKAWRTVDAPRDLVHGVKSVKRSSDMVIVDCLTLFISNLVCGGVREAVIKRQVGSALKLLSMRRGLSVIVSNEVGLGIVPENVLAREFRDIAGRVNQDVAKFSDEVYFVVSGIPWRIK